MDLLVLWLRNVWRGASENFIDVIFSADDWPDFFIFVFRFLTSKKIDYSNQDNEAPFYSPEYVLLLYKITEQKLDRLGTFWWETEAGDQKWKLRGRAGKRAGGQ
jgi:hypothetical protein